MSNIQSLINSQEGPSTLVIMSGEQLQKLIDDVRNDTRRIVEEQYQPKYFTIDDMMELFKVGQSTIYNWISRGIIKPLYLVEGGRPYFDQAEIRKQMASGSVGKHIRK